MWAEGMPDEAFRFHKRELDRWANGHVWVLHPGVDFPPEMPVRDVKRRLVSAAAKRDVDISVWWLNGNVHFMMCPWNSFRGANPD